MQNPSQLVPQMPAPPGPAPVQSPSPLVAMMLATWSRQPSVLPVDVAQGADGEGGAEAHARLGRGVLELVARAGGLDGVAVGVAGEVVRAERLDADHVAAAEGHGRRDARRRRGARRRRAEQRIIGTPSRRRGPRCRARTWARSRPGPSWPAWARCAARGRREDRDDARRQRRAADGEHGRAGVGQGAGGGLRVDGALVAARGAGAQALGARALSTRRCRPARPPRRARPRRCSPTTMPATRCALARRHGGGSGAGGRRPPPAPCRRAGGGELAGVGVVVEGGTVTVCAPALGGISMRIDHVFLPGAVALRV